MNERVTVLGDVAGDGHRVHPGHLYPESILGDRALQLAGVASLLSGDGGDFLIIDEVDSQGSPQGNKTFLPRKTALSYGVTLGAVSARADARLTSAASLMKALNSDSSLACHTRAS